MESVNVPRVSWAMAQGRDWVTVQVRALRERAGYSMDNLALAMGYKRASSIQRYEDPAIYKKPYLDRDLVAKLASALVGKGEPTITEAEVWALAGPEFADRAPTEATVPVMGYVGAGAEVEPDFEQVPPEGLEEVTIPFGLPDDMIAFKVRGDSMLPQFRDGVILVVFREQRRAIETFYGEEAVVRTDDGRRFIKTIARGGGAGLVTLSSWNARPIEDVRPAWIGEIFTAVYPSALRRAVRQGGVQGQLKLRAAG